MKNSLVVVFATLLAASCFAQTNLNLANGIPPNGSYGGSNVDTVNLLNGNLTLHIPLPVDVPQRGKLAVKYYLVVNAKSWIAAFDPTYQANQWSPSSVCSSSTSVPPASGPCGQGPVFVSTASLGMTRGYTETFTDGVGTDYTVSDPNGVDTWDGSGHGLVQIGTTGVYTAVDTSGYRVQVSGSSGLGGTPYDVLITDRNGTQYKGTFHHDQDTCKTDPGNGLPGSTSTTNCTEHFELSSITDANGNVLSAPLGVPKLDVPNWNGPTVSAHLATSTEVSGCQTSFGTPWVYYLDYPGPNGQTNEIKLCFGVFPQLSTSFSPANIHQFQDVYGQRAFPGSYRQPIYLSDVILPDGTKWSIGYDVYGQIIDLETPTGGRIQYDWREGQFPAPSGTLTSVSRAVHTRTVTDASGKSFIWTYQWGTQDSNGTVTHTATDPNNNDTVHVFAPIINTTQPFDLKEQHTYSYQGTGGSRTLLQEVDTTWQIHNDGGMGVPTDKQTTLYPSGKVSREHTDYDTSAPTLGIPIAHEVYDWGVNSPGALLRETHTVYLWQLDSRYATANMLDLPASTITISPVAGANTKPGCPVSPGITANCMAETDYTYDEAAYLTSYETTVGALPTGSHVAAPNPAPARGNLSTVSKWVSTGGSVVSHANWYDTGEPHIQSDPLGHNTTISYDLAYNGALPTMTCNAKGQCVSATYDVNTGLLTSFTDQNASSQASGTSLGDATHTWTYCWDQMARLKGANFPADPLCSQPLTSFAYSDPTTVKRSQLITSALTDTLTTHLDGLGHATQTELLTPEGTVIVHTDYDGLGQATSVTNPYLTTADATYGTVQTAYDGLGRPTTITEQDQSVKHADYSGGNCITSTDGAGKQRRSCSDALGRLVEVDEPNPGSVNVAAQGTLSFSGSLGVQNGVGSRSATQATGTITVTGTAPSPVTVCNPDITPTVNNPCPGARTISDHGTVTLSVGGHADSVTYSASETSGSVALALQSAVNGDAGALIHVNSVSGGSLIVQSVAAGSGTNYSWSISSQSQDTTGTFGPGPGPFSGGPGSLSGGTDAYAGTTVYDKGTLTLNVGGFSGQVCYGTSSDCAAPPSCPTGNSTAVQVACFAASVLNSSASPVSASYSGTASLTITDKTAGQGGNGLAVTVTAASTQTLTTFSPPSFSSGGATLGSGMNAGDVNNQPFVTLYSYDALGDLLCVEQHGNVTGTGCSAAPSSDATSPWRVRRFTYDSLGRLLTAYNPESGTITYSYDADGNLLQKTSPAPNQTGTATQTISYCYDELNRETGKAYSAQSCPLTSPAATFTYDVAPANSPAPLSNTIGRLTGFSTGSTATIQNYDPLGRVITQWECTSVNCGHSWFRQDYGYNLAGDVTSHGFNQAFTISQSYDSAGRLAQVTSSIADALHPGTLATVDPSMGYYPGSELRKITLGNGLTQTAAFNTRLQPCRSNVNSSGAALSQCSDSLPAGNVMDMGYGFNFGAGDNGNLTTFSATGAQAFNRAYSYDALNRLVSMSAPGDGCSGLTWQDDAWGNRTAQTAAAGTCHSFQNAGTVQNQLVGYAYDAAGNMTSDGSHSYTYDAESRVSQVDGGATATYVYDASGQRVQKATPAAQTNYWLDLDGNTAVEWNQNSDWMVDYIYVNGSLLAQYYAGTTGFFLKDHLSSTRLVTGPNQAILDSMDYLPYGEQIAGGAWTKHKLTGKERDSESGLDYFGARHYSNGLGRFLTPDWSEEPDPVPFANLGSPQSLNLYRYASNNPISFVDPDGHDCVVQTRTGDKSESVSVSSGTCDGVKVGDGQSATYVPGTVTSVQAGQDGHSIDIGYKPYDGGSAGVQNANAAPYPDRPGIAYGFHAAAYSELGLASRVTNNYIAAPLMTFLSFAVPGAFSTTLPQASLGLGVAVVSGVGKAAAKQAVEDLAISQVQKTALKREIARATTREAVSVERLADGSYRVLRTRPGADGYQVFSKVVDGAGNTRSAQTAVNGAGDIVHYDPKN